MKILHAGISKREVHLLHQNTSVSLYRSDQSLMSDYALWCYKTVKNSAYSLRMLHSDSQSEAKITPEKREHKQYRKYPLSGHHG